MEIFTDYSLGKKLNFHYLNAKPFPNVVIDNFINPTAAMWCFKELKESNLWATENTINNPFMTDNQVNKWFCPWDSESVEIMKYRVPTVYAVLQYLNSEIFLQFLKDLTGINNLIPDPHFWGGGCHKIQKGGKLNLHVDYNVNKVTKKFRVLNLLLYLNPDWEDSWNGHLELWNRKEKKREHLIAPIMNRAVIFNLSDESVHGHPVPLECPEGFERYSFALYYFVDEPNQEYYERQNVRWHNELQTH
jgi:hypothetical protein